MTKSNLTSKSRGRTAPGWGEPSVRDRFASLFRAEVACTTGHANTLGARPFVDAAERLSEGLEVDLGTGLGKDMPVIHLRENWDSVASLARESGARVSGTALSLVEACEKRLAGNGPAPAEQFFLAVLAAWDVLGGYGRTFRALVDVVDMTCGWPEDESAREVLREAAQLMLDGCGDETLADRVPVSPEQA